MIGDWKIELFGSAAEFTLIHIGGGLTMSGPRTSNHAYYIRPAPPGRHLFRVLSENLSFQHRHLVLDAFADAEFSYGHDDVYLSDADLVAIKLAAE